MKKKVWLVLFSITLGILFTFFILNKEDIYAKEEYLVYAFQVGSFDNKENATNFANNLPSAYINLEDKSYKVYVAIYKDIDIVNKMVVYFENNNINIYLKALQVDKDFYNILNNYEKIIINTNDYQVYDKVNQSILNTYAESI